MPGKGEARERDYTPEERAALAQGVEALGLSLEAAPPLSTRLRRSRRGGR